MKLARIPRAFTWIGKDEGFDQPVFTCQGQPCGDSVQVHSIMARRAGALGEAIPLVIDDARGMGARMLRGLMEPFVIVLLQRATASLNVEVRVDREVVLYDGKPMQWVTVMLAAGTS